MEDMIKEALISKVGISEEQATKAVEVVMGIVGGKGSVGDTIKGMGEAAKDGIGDKIGDVVGGILGKK